MDEDGLFFCFEEAGSVENHSDIFQLELFVKKVVEDTLTTFISSHKPVHWQRKMWRLREMEFVGRIWSAFEFEMSCLWWARKIFFSYKNYRKKWGRRENIGITSLQVLEGPRVFRA
jgi:hypothetical protein